MDPYEEEAFRAKQMAERRFIEKDFNGARNYALKARSLFPGLEGISQMVETFDVHIASQSRRDSEIDYYAILGLKPSAGKREVKKQHKKMAIMLHPDKNKCIGADGAFQLISDAWTFLSNEFEKSSFYYKRKKHIDSMAVQKKSSEYVSGVAGFDFCPPASERVDTFWTVCTSCKVQYEYLRKYVNKRLSCKNCRGVFIAVETGPAPVSASFHYAASSHTPSNGYGGHGYDDVTHMPTSSTYFGGHNPGHGYDYVMNGSFGWNSYTGTTPRNMDSSGMPSMLDGYGYKLRNGVVSRGSRKVKEGSNGTFSMKSTAAALMIHSSDGFTDASAIKVSRTEKKRKLVSGFSGNGYDEYSSKSTSELRTTNTDRHVGQDFKLPGQRYFSTRRWSAAPSALDTRELLINKARADIRQKLDVTRLASEAVTTENRTLLDEKGIVSSKVGDASAAGNSVSPGQQLVRKTNGPVTMTVPDPDFHDFDKNRSEDCFQPRQIWAIYDEDDGMPRLYCMVREVFSVQPFKIDIGYLSSKTDAEFGSTKWVDYGFVKSCGHFRIRNTDIVEQVNIFSHLLKGKKTGRGGCVRIFPKTGEIWAVYRDWSPNWNRSTPDEVRHRYEMVEILDDYTEELGVCVVPLYRLEGFKTVYRRSKSKRWIPRREMLRFSHQVPSWFLRQESSGLPGNCWDLDPAAIPEELLETGGLTDQPLFLQEGETEIQV
ncbi:PREDICTED: uncharacterized protein LOC104815361 [Tarenaya hassleriana]|uniref:uncharacterized protein LOC104815361 n=1 Tax=Tarenaya hassleriana TaxID=28532 RepID=UPI00053C9ABD|nr:PREDICTED: uncharacterized protein LOC104815361 [Tarenaya hassleriana]